MMERTTGIYKGRYGIKTSVGYLTAYELSAGHYTEQVIREIQRGIKRLAAYESIGLTPKQLKEVDKLYLEKCIEVNCCNCDWIPVEKRLPAPNDDVLVTVQEIGENTASVAMDCILNERGRLSWGTYFTANERVLAWKPRPVPYNPKTDGRKFERGMQ